MMTLYVSDRNPSLGPVPITRSDGSVVDISSFTSMKFALRGEYDTTNLFGPTTAVIVAPPVTDDLGNTFRDPNGVAVACARYDFAVNDLASATPGIYLGQWVGVDGSGKTQHYDAGRYMIVKGF